MPEVSERVAFYRKLKELLATGRHMAADFGPVFRAFDNLDIPGV
jgi:hypothetical protein